MLYSLVIRQITLVDDALSLTLRALDALRLNKLHLEAQTNDTTQFGLEFLLQPHHRGHIVGEVVFLHLDLQLGGIGIIHTID